MKRVENMRPSVSFAGGRSEVIKRSNYYDEWFYTSREMCLKKKRDEWTASMQVSAFDENNSFLFTLKSDDSRTNGLDEKLEEPSGAADFTTMSLIAGREIYALISGYIAFWDVKVSWKLSNDKPYQFCLVKLKLYSDDDRSTLTRYLHLDQFTKYADCGCFIQQPFECMGDPQCDLYDKESERHDMTVTAKYAEFCSVKEIQKLKRQQINEVDQIRVEVEIVLGRRNYENSWMNYSFADDKQKKWSMMKTHFVLGLRRQDMLRDKTRKASVIFKLKSGETVPVHEEVLQEGRSDMLNCMIESDMMEARTREIPVTDESFTLPIFQDFVNGLYGDWTNREMEINCDNFDLLFSRLKICHYYSAHQLLDLTIGTIVGNPHPVFTTSSALEMYKLGCVYNIKCLKSRCMHWMQFNDDLSYTKFKELARDVDELMKTLNDPADQNPLLAFVKNKSSLY